MCPLSPAKSSPPLPQPYVVLWLHVIIMLSHDALSLAANYVFAIHASGVCFGGTSSGSERDLEVNEIPLHVKKPLLFVVCMCFCQYTAIALAPWCS